MYLHNLWLAVIQLFTESKDIVSFLLNLDRLGNALCGGDYRATVSGRVGYFALYRTNRYWLCLQWVIDETFRPIDGKRHCYYAMKWENGKSYRRSSDVALAALSIVVLLACLVICIPIWLIARFKD